MKKILINQKSAEAQRLASASPLILNWRSGRDNHEKSYSQNCNNKKHAQNQITKPQAQTRN